MDSVVGPAAAMDEGLACSAALRLAAPEPAATDCASRPSSGATLQYCNQVAMYGYPAAQCKHMTTRGCYERNVCPSAV